MSILLRLLSLEYHIPAHTGRYWRCYVQLCEKNFLRLFVLPGIRRSHDVFGLDDARFSYLTNFGGLRQVRTLNYNFKIKSNGKNKDRFPYKNNSHR